MQWGSAFLLPGDLTEQRHHLEVRSSSKIESQRPEGRLCPPFPIQTKYLAYVSIMYLAHSLTHVPQELEHREKQYDGRERLDVYASDDDAEPALSNVLTFVATSKNVHWLGPASMESVAQQIAAATGPSGPNYEYLDCLAAALWKVSSSLCILC